MPVTVSVSPTQDAIDTILRSFLTSILPATVEVVLGQVNRVPEPAGADFVAFTWIDRVRLETNVDDAVITSNLVPYPNDFTQAYWDFGGTANVVPDAVPGPAGIGTADFLGNVPSGGTNEGRIESNAPFTADMTVDNYELALFVRNNGVPPLFASGPDLFVGIYTVIGTEPFLYVECNIATGSVTSLNFGAGASVITGAVDAVSPGWWRVRLIGSSGVSGQHFIDFGIFINDQNPAHGIYVANANLFNTATAKTATQNTEIVYQIDVYGPNAADNAQIISTLLRDEYAFDAFQLANGSVAPLYADDPRQLPVVYGEEQYENRWVVEARVQANQAVTVAQDYADIVTVTPESVDVVYPP